MRGQVGFEVIVSMAVAMSLALLVTGAFYVMSHGTAGAHNSIQQAQEALNASIQPYSDIGIRVLG